MSRYAWTVLSAALLFGATSMGTDRGYAEEPAASDASLNLGDQLEPTWTVQSGALLLQRSRPGVERAPIDYFNATNPANFDVCAATGWDLGITRHNVADTGWNVEGRFFSLDSANSAAGSFPATQVENALFAPYDYSGRYTSGLMNFELNARRELSDRLTFLAGIRYLSLTEDLHIGEAAHLSPVFDITSNTAYHTTNDLFGGQIGLDSHLWQRGIFGVDGLIKAGVFNDLATASGVRQSSVGLNGAGSASTNQISFVGEVALAGRCQISQSLSIRAGYQLMWVDAVALASNQDPGLIQGGMFPQPSTMNTDGCPLYHGAFVGVEFTR